MGSIFSPKVPAAPTPPPETKYNFRDELSGVEQVRQENPDGSVTMVTRALPLSPEEQAAKDNYDRIIKETGARIEDLTVNYDISKIPGLSDTIEGFRSGQQRNLDQATGRRTEQEERALARFGVEDSTSASQTRSQRGRDYVDSELQIGENARLLENDIRQQELGNNKELFALATGQQQQSFADKLSGLQLGQSAVNAEADRSQQRNLAIYNGNLNQQALKAQSASTGLSNLAGLGQLAIYGLGRNGFGVLGRKK